MRCPGLEPEHPPATGKETAELSLYRQIRFLHGPDASPRSLLRHDAEPVRPLPSLPENHLLFHQGRKDLSLRPDRQHRQNLPATHRRTLSGREKRLRGGQGPDGPDALRVQRTGAQAVGPHPALPAGL